MLVAETLAATLKACPRIKGLSLPAPLSSPSFLSQYADDTSILVITDDSILAVFEVFDRYELGSGARLNLKKCKGLWVGAWKNRVSGHVDIRWSSVKLRCLGSFLGPGDLSHDNWDPRIQALKNLLSSWRQRSLTLQGKALVINALALSGLWYLGSVMCPPDWVISKINTEIFSFFGRGKRIKSLGMLFVSRSLLVALVLWMSWPNFVPFMWRGFVVFVSHLQVGLCFLSCFVCSFLVMTHLLF